MSQVKTRLLKNNFTNGIISQQLYQRNDWDKFKNSVKDAVNFTIIPQGGMQFRRGTQYVCESKPVYKYPLYIAQPFSPYGVHLPIAYSPELKILVYLPQSSDGTRSVLVIRDLKNYIVEEYKFDEDILVTFEHVIWVSELKLFVAVASAMTTNVIPSTYRCAISSDGKTWSFVNIGENNEWRWIAWSPKLKQLVAVSYTGTHRIAVSPDGVNWTLRNVPLQSWYRVIWADFLDLFVAVSQDGANRILTSNNGVTWTSSDTGYAKVWSAITALPDRIILISGGGEGTDTVLKGVSNGIGGITWTSLGALLTNDWEDVTYCDTEDVIIACSTNRNNRLIESYDKGVTWQLRTETTTQAQWSRIIWVDSLQKVIVSGSTPSYLTIFDFGLAEYRRVKYIPFVFSKEDALLVELGNKYARFIKNNELITNRVGFISSITNAFPATVSFFATTLKLQNGDHIIITDVEGMTEVNHVEYEIDNLSFSNGSGTFQLKSTNSTNYNPYSSGGKINKIVEISTPYTEDEIDDVKYTQSADVMYMFHRKYPTYKVSRLSDTSWVTSNFNPSPFPSSEQNTYLDNWLAINSITYSGTTATVTITAGHPYVNSQYVTITNANEKPYNGTFQISNVTGTTFQYTMSEIPNSNATGNPKVSGTTLKIASTSGNQILCSSGDNVFYDSDIGRYLIYGTARAVINSVEPNGYPSDVKVVSSITHSGKTATATVTSHGYANNDRVVILGANEKAYNGKFTIKNVTANTFQYTMNTNPGRDATGTLIMCYKSQKIVAVSNLVFDGVDTATATTASAHGFLYGDKVEINGANQSAYNGNFFIFDVTATQFSYYITGSPNSPATGDITASLVNKTNVVTLNIESDFTDTNPIPAGSWYLDSSPQSKLTFPERGKRDKVMTVEADTATFRNRDVGKYIKIPRGDTGEYAIFLITKYRNWKSIDVKTLIKIYKSDSLVLDEGGWTLEAPDWTSTLGYPSVGIFFQDRLCFARDATIWMSASGDYENFNLGDKDDNAIKISLLSREIDNIVWFDVNKHNLLIGTEGGEWMLSGSTNDIRVTPTSIVVSKQSNYGAYSKTDVVSTPFGTIFVDISSVKPRLLSYDFSSDGYIAQDLGLLSSHLFQYKIKRMAYVSEPIPQLFIVSEQGELFVCTFLPNQSIIGWTRYSFAYGFVEDVIVIPGNKYNNVYVNIIRDIGGESKRYLEKLELPYTYDEKDNLPDLKEDNFLGSIGTNTYKYGYYFNYKPKDLYTEVKGLTGNYLDCSKTYIGIKTTSINNLNHLNNAYVQAVVDGIPENTLKLVQNGRITLDTTPTNVVQVGLPYHGYLQFLPFNIQLGDGDSFGLIQRVIQVMLNVMASSVFKIGDSLSNLRESKFITYDNTNYTLWDGDVEEKAFGGQYRRIPDVYVKQEKPLPLNILSVVTELEYETKN